MQWRIVAVFSTFMASARRTWLTLYRCRHAARSTATPFHFFIRPGGAHHPLPSRRVSVRNYSHRLRRCGYVVQTYHPAPLGAADPIEGCILCYRNVRYFLPPDDDADYLVETVLNQNRSSWFTPPHYVIIIIGDIFVVSSTLNLRKEIMFNNFLGVCPAGAAAVGAGMPYQKREMDDGGHHTNTRGCPNGGVHSPGPPGVGGGMDPPPPPPQHAGLGGGATAHRGFGILRHQLRHPKIGRKNVRPGDHPGGARRAAKGNP